MSSVGERMYESQYDAHHGNQRTHLNHGPGRPVQRDKVLSVAELKSHEAKGLHDDDDGRGTDATEAKGDV